MTLSAPNLPPAPASSRYSKPGSDTKAGGASACDGGNGGFDEVLADLAPRCETPKPTPATPGSQVSVSRRNGMRGLEMKARGSTEPQTSLKKKPIAEDSPDINTVQTNAAQPAQVSPGENPVSQTGDSEADFPVSKENSLTTDQAGVASELADEAP